jgi:hypothetical protein
LIYGEYGQHAEEVEQAQEQFQEWVKHLQTCWPCHASVMAHPADPELKFLTVFPIDAVKKKAQLLEKEVWCQENDGVNKFGHNKLSDLATV